MRKLAKRMALMIPPIRNLYDEMLRLQVKLQETEQAQALRETARAQPDNRAIVEFVDRWFSESLLLRARENLFLAKALEPDAGQPFLGVRWDAYSKQLINDISNFTSVFQAISYAQTKIGFETRVNEDICGQFLDGFMASMDQTYPNCAQFIAASGESPLSLLTDENGVIRRNGRLFALQQVINVEVFCYIFTKLGAVAEYVLEIGGGYGSSCRDWVNMSGEHLKKYFILDIPESIFYSEVYLKAHFGVDSVVNMAEPNFEAKSRTAKIVLCPLPLAGRLLQEKIDIAINVGSMQEMSGEWLEYYEKFLSTAKITSFYSSNYFFNPVNSLTEGMNLYTPRLGAEWGTVALQFMVAPRAAQGDSPSEYRHVMRAFFRKGLVTNDEIGELEEVVPLFENRAAEKPIDQAEGEALFRFIFAFRRDLPASLTLRLIRALSANFSYIPKETLYLVRRLLQDSQELSASERQELEALRDRLVAMLPVHRKDVI